MSLLTAKILKAQMTKAIYERKLLAGYIFNKDKNDIFK